MEETTPKGCKFTAIIIMIVFFMLAAYGGVALISKLF